MDNIAKQVQGYYLNEFGRNLKYVMHLVKSRQDQSQNHPIEKNNRLKDVIKIFKTWEVLGLFDQNMLNDIAANLQLRPLVSFSVTLT